LEQKDLKYSHFSVIVSKKTNKRAVGRNTIKRLIYSIISQKWLKLSPGFNVLVFSKPNLAKKEDLSGISAEVISLLQQANILAN
jgi:ribonuclease P protein component